MSKKSELGDGMAIQLNSMVAVGKLLPYVREHRFALEIGRQWRFDFAWPEQKVALEVEGGVHFGKSRHTTSGGFIEDCHKYNAAAVMGWTLIRADPRLVTKGWALEYVMDVLNGRSVPTLRKHEGTLYLRTGLHNHQ